MPQDVSISHVRETFEDWSMYEAVIRHNYMCHHELAGGLKAIAAGVAGGLSIVDLGCGDAWLATHAFRDAAVNTYLGVDLSESAVERARGNSSFWGSRARLCRGNIADLMTTLADESANLVLASNSLHHFDSNGKVTIVRHCFRCLAPQGIFCWIDPVRNEDETRDGYLRRLTTVMQHDWVGLSEDQRRHAITHVWKSDYPETASWMRHGTEQAGFKFGDRFLQNDLFGAWKFIKP